MTSRRNFLAAFAAAVVARSALAAQPPEIAVYLSPT
jgi:hypothetical protein